ncbi:MAG TPA: LLM class flavin-dependent oxidoreductase [Thermoleophilaceae bacterium]
MPPLGLVRLWALLVRAGGFDSVLFEDHLQEFYPRALWDRRFSWLSTHAPSPHELFDFQVLLGSLAPRLGRTRVGVGVTEAIRRHPVVIAQAMLTLAHMTRRPPILGVGAGERLNTEPYGLDFSHPTGRLEEALEIIRLCLTSTGPIDYAGRHFRLEGAVLDLSAPPGRTPEIWVAAHGPRGLRLTGRYGDGWLPHVVSSPEEYGAKLEVIRAAARDAARNPDAITASLMQYVVAAPTERRARALLGSRLVRFLALVHPAEAWRRQGEHHPWGKGFRGYIDILPESLDPSTLDEALAAVPFSVLDDVVIWGTPERVAEQLRAFGAAGLQHVAIGLMTAMISRRGAAYAVYANRRIAGLLAGRGLGSPRHRAPSTTG